MPQEECKELSELLKYKDFFSTTNMPFNISEIISTKYKYLDTLFDSVEQTTAKIPLISHHIWLINRVKPKEVKGQDIVNLRATIDILNQDEENWEHVFWTNCKTCLPKTLEELSQLPSLQVREISEIADQLIYYAQVEAATAQNKFGMAADMLRLDLLNSFGGFYSDLDYNLYRSPLKYMRKYDFIADSTSSGGMYLSPVLSTPGHKIIAGALVTIDEIYKSSLYQATLNCSIVFQTGVLTALSFDVSCYRHANKYHTKDLIFPPDYQLKGAQSLKHIPDLERQYDSKGLTLPPESQEVQVPEQKCEIRESMPNVEEQLLLLYENEICLAGNYTFGYDPMSQSWVEE